MTRAAWDAWAFIETARTGPRAADVAALTKEAHDIVTTRDVVAETFTYLANAGRRTEEGWRWWNDLRQSPVRILDPTRDELWEYARSRRRGSLSFADLSLGWACDQEGILEVATGDAEFRSLGLRPLFATR